MITEEIGLYLQKTKNELEDVLKQLNQLSIIDRNGPQGENLQQLYVQLQSTMQTIYQKIGQNQDFLYNQLLNNFDHTVQKLPTVEEKSPKSQHRSKRQSAQGGSTTLPQIESLVQFKGKSALEFKPLGTQQYSAKGIHSQFLKHSSSILLQKKPLRNLSQRDQSQLNTLIKNQSANLYAFKKSLIKPNIQMEFEKPEIVKFDNSPPSDFSQNPPYPPPLNTLLLQSKIKSSKKKLFNDSANQSQNEFKPDFSEPKNNLPDSKNLDFNILQGYNTAQTPEYQAFKRAHTKQWPIIMELIKSLERLTQQFNVSSASVNGQALFQLASSLKGRQINTQDLIKCFNNKTDFGLKYEGEEGRVKAITKIQANARRWKAQQDYARLQVMVGKVKHIQKFARNFLLVKQTRRKIFEYNVQVYERFKQRQFEFKQSWQQNKARVEIHVNSFSYEESRRLTMEKFLQRQNSQLTRIFTLLDPNISIVYVVPFNFQTEIMNYYYKILELGEIPNFEHRLHFIWPEAHLSFPSHLSTGRLLLYSPKALKRIKQIIKGKKAYIVPGSPSNEDILLCEALGGIPLFSGEPQLHMVNSTKSGSKRIFQALQIPSAPCALEIYDEKELINTLAILIANNPQVQSWLLKIDDESYGRGTACLEVKKLGKFFRGQKIQQTQESVIQIATILQNKLCQKLNIAYQSLYKSYDEYILAFTRRGGIIEACPSSSLSSLESPSFFFKIEPNGLILPLGTFDKIRINDFQTIGCSGPKQSLKNINVQYICQNIGEYLYSKGLFGYIQLDLVAFKQNENQLFWATGLDCHLTTLSSSCFYFDFLMRGKLDPLTGSYSVIVSDSSISFNKSIQQNIQQKNQEQQFRSFMYCPMLINEGLEALQYKTFFQLCRLESISFNLEKKVGSTFLLIDSLQCGMLSLVTVGDSTTSVLKYMLDALEFLVKNVGRGNEGQDYLDSRTDKIRMMSVLQKIKFLLKRHDSRNQKSHRTQSSNIYL